MAAAMWEMARSAYADGHFHQALDLYTDAISAGPASAALYFYRSLALIKVGRCTEASKALELDPEMHKAYLLKGIALYKMEEYEDAIDDLKNGLSYDSNNSSCAFLLAKCQEHVAEEANEAYKDGSYILSAKLYQKAINTGLHTAGLYAKCAMSLLRIDYYDGAVVLLNKAIEFEPTMHAAYLLKGIALYKLQDYKTAKETLQLGLSNSPDDSRFADLLKKCQKGIARQTKLKRKPRIVYYNHGNEVLLAISTFGIHADAVKVDFAKDMVTILIHGIPGKDPYCYQAKLSAEIIPGKCKYRVLHNELEVRLMKAKSATWTSFSLDRDSSVDDYEFSWTTKLLNGKNLLSRVRNQGDAGTCSFQAVTAAAEIELKRKAAEKNPPESCKISLDTNSLIVESEEVIGPSLKMEDILQVFMEKGVVARGKGVNGKCKLNGFQSAKRMHFSKMKQLIESGRPIVGGLMIDKFFDHLDPDEIYDFNPAHALKNENGSTMGHAVVFIGCGVRDGRAYLVFLNSYGTGFGDRGFGRAYLGSLTGRKYVIDV